jgi:hypothetical protein
MKFIRSILSLLLTVAILPVVGEFFIKLAEQAGFYESLFLRWGRLAEWISWSVDAFYLRYVATSLLGIFVGQRLATISRRDNEADTAELNSIGQRALVLAAMITRQARRPGWREPEDFDHITGEIAAVFARMTRAGILVPNLLPDLDSRDRALIAERFFRAVGPLARDGSLDEARVAAIHFLQDAQPA